MKTKTKMPKQQNLSLNESASIQYGAYECYGRTALNLWPTVDSIYADHQHVFVSRFDILWLLVKLKRKNTAKLKINPNKNHTACAACLKVVSPSLSTGSVTSAAQLVATNLPAELAAKLKEINPPPSNNMGIIDVAARIKVCK